MKNQEPGTGVVYLGGSGDLGRNCAQHSEPECWADQAGLTLLEVLVATVLLGLVLVAVFGLFTTGTRMEGAAVRHMEALRLAETKLEEYKAKDYVQVVATGPETVVIQDIDGEREVTVATGVIATGVETKTVTVTVSWPEHGQTETVTLAMERVKR